MRIFGFITALFMLIATVSYIPLAAHAQGPIPTSEPSFSKNPCDSILDATQNGECDDCMGSLTSPGVWTAIGCIEDIQSNPNALLQKVIGLAMGVAGGIAFLLTLFGGFQIMTSAGNPEALNAGRELVTSAITGLLLIIFSVFLLQFIGVNIIGIPGFG